MARTPDSTDNLVSEEDIRIFHEDGAVCLRAFLSQEWLDTVAEGFDQAAAGTSTPV